MIILVTLFSLERSMRRCSDFNSRTGGKVFGYIRTCAKWDEYFPLYPTPHHRPPNVTHALDHMKYIFILSKKLS